MKERLLFHEKASYKNYPLNITKKLMFGLFKTFAHGRQLCGSKQFACPYDVPENKVIVYEWLCRFVSVMHRTDASDTPWRIYLLLTI